MAWPVLSVVTFLPLLGALLIVIMTRGNGPLAKGTARWIAMWTTLVTFAVSLVMVQKFDAASAEFQFAEKHDWLGVASYHMGVDGSSLPFVILTTALMPICILASWTSVQKRVKEYMIAFLVLETLMIGTFSALDLVLFYLFFEGGLIPMFLIIGVWGGPRRVYASFKFFLYTLAGSVLMLLAIMAMFWEAGTTDIPTLLKHGFPLGLQQWAWFAFFASFAVKMPMWPVHTWLPDAHVEAPTGGSVILAAIMLKIGGYGFLRFSLPIVPDACQEFAWLIVALSLIAIIYVGYVALVQDDMKKLIAYSSVAHMGFVTLGLFIAFALMRVSGNTQAAYLGVQGSMVQMISHGFVSGAMFTCVGVLYDRMHTRMIRDYGGVVNTMPWFAAFWVLFSMANCGLPGTSGFVGEFMVILASFAMNPWVAAGAAFTLIIGAAYTLYLVKRVIWGDVTNEHVAKLKDINPREALVLGLFAAGVLILGVWPEPLTHLMDASVKHIVDQLLVVKT